MTYDQLLPVYRQITGLPGQDDAFNHWVQGIIDDSHSSGTATIPDNYFNTPQGQSYVQKTTTVNTPGAGTGAATGTTAGGFGQLVAPTPTAPAFTQAPTPDVTGGNYNQTQNATQGGQFGTVGTNTQQQATTSGQNQTGTTATSGTNNTQQQQNQTTANQEQNYGTSNTTGTQSNDSRTTGTTTQSTQGSDVQQALDSLGFGKLLQDQAASTTASDATRNAWLTNTMNTGGDAFNSQVEQAVRNSLTGPQITGAGDSARARAAGYAGAQVARTNLDERLNAAQQLAGPTGLTTLSTAADPYIGKSTTSSGTGTTFQDLLTQGTSNTTGTTNTAGGSSGLASTVGNTNSQNQSNQLQNSSQDTTGFQNLLSKGSEVQAGTTQGQSSQTGVGQIPQGQPVQSGGCVLCTAAVEMKLPRSNILRVLRRVINHKLNVDRTAFANAARGYFAVFTPFARWLLTHPRTATLLYPLARATVYEELRISGRRLPWKAIPCCIHWTGHTFCAAVGRFFPVQGHVTDPVITDVARRNNILFEVNS